MATLEGEELLRLPGFGEGIEDPCSVARDLVTEGNDWIVTENSSLTTCLALLRQKS